MDLLPQLTQFFAQYGYLAVLVALLLCGIGLPLPEDITLVAGGVMAGMGYANVHLMCLWALFGVLAGDMAMFSLGYHYGARLLRFRWAARLLTPKRYKLVQQKFEHYGNRLLFMARFLPGIRSAIFISAGFSHRVTPSRFLCLDGAAALISVPVWVYLGYFGANNHEWLVKWVRRGQAGLWGTLLLTAAIIGIYIWLKYKRKGI